MNLGDVGAPVEITKENALEHLLALQEELENYPRPEYLPIVLPPWYVDQVFIPNRRSRRRPKKALYKRLLAHSRRIQKERGLR